MNGQCKNVTIRKGQIGRSTAFCKDLSDVYLKNVNNQRLNQSYHDTRSWYHGTAVSLECVQAPSLPSGSLGASLQAIFLKGENHVFKPLGLPFCSDMSRLFWNLQWSADLRKIQQEAKDREKGRVNVPSIPTNWKILCFSKYVVAPCVNRKRKVQYHNRYHILETVPYPHSILIWEEYATGDTIGMQQGYKQLGAWPPGEVSGSQKMTVFVVKDRTKRSRFKRNH